jgi:hypothetical protein
MPPVVGLGAFRKCFTPPGIYRHHGALTELAIRVGPRVRIRLAPAGVGCELDFLDRGRRREEESSSPSALNREVWGCPPELAQQKPCHTTKMPHGIIRRENGRRYEVDFGDASGRVQIYGSEETAEIFIGADFETLPEERRRFALLNVPRRLFSEATAAAVRRGPPPFRKPPLAPRRSALRQVLCSWEIIHRPVSRELFA